MRRLLAVGLLGFAAVQLPAQDAGARQGARMQAANEALEARDFARALKLLTVMAGEVPRNATVMYDLGSAQDALEQTSAAEVSYRAAIADDAGLASAHVALGLLLARSGRMDEARTELISAAALPADDAPAKALRGRALRTLARIDEKARPSDARDELLNALKITPETPEDTLLSAELAEAASGGSSAAEAAYRRVLAKMPNDPAAAAALAHLLIAERKNGEAEQMLRTALEAHPADESLTLQLALALMADGKAADALPLVEALHAASPAEATLSRYLADLYVQQKEYGKAEPLLAHLSAQAPQDGVLADDWAKVLLRLRRFVDAEHALEHAIASPELFPRPADFAAASFDIAFAASQNGQPARVLQVLENSSKVLPPSLPMMFLTAISEDKLHRTKQARQAYQEFLKASQGALPDEEFEAQHRLTALERVK